MPSTFTIAGSTLKLVLLPLRGQLVPTSQINWSFVCNSSPSRSTPLPVSLFLHSNLLTRYTEYEYDRSPTHCPSSILHPTIFLFKVCFILKQQDQVSKLPLAWSILLHIRNPVVWIMEGGLV